MSNEISIKNIEKIDKPEIKHFKNITKSGNILENVVHKEQVKSQPKLMTPPSKKTPIDTFDLLTNPLKNSDRMSEQSADEGSASLNDESVSDLSEQFSKQLDLMNHEEDEEQDVKEENVIDFDQPFVFNKKNISDNFDEDDEDEDEDEDAGGHETPNFSSNMEDNITLSSNEEDDEEDMVSVKEKTYEEIQSEKQDLLFKLDRLDKSGFKSSRKYTMASNLEDLQFEYTKLKRQRDVEKSIKFSRKILMAIVSGVEFLNGKFDPFDIRLKGWSENVMESITDYDEVFEELHDKYSDSVKVSPELKLIMMVSGSAFMFHLTQSLFKTNSPSLNDILKQNPDIMRNISQAAVQQMGPAMGEDLVGNLMKEGIQQTIDRRSQQSPMQQPMMMPTGPPSAPPPPTGGSIEDIVNDINGGKKKKSNKKSITLDL